MPAYSNKLPEVLFWATCYTDTEHADSAESVMYCTNIISLKQKQTQITEQHNTHVFSLHDKM